MNDECSYLILLLQKYFVKNNNVLYLIGFNSDDHVSKVIINIIYRCINLKIYVVSMNNIYK